MKLLIPVIMLCISLQCQAQINDTMKAAPVKGSAQWHVKKRNSLYVGSGLTLVTGVIITVVSINAQPIFPINQTPEDRRKQKAAETWSWIGIGMITASIPVFVIARSHNRKAKILLRNEKAFLPDPANRKEMIALGLRYSLQ
jgi:hypothetical protein